MNLAPLPAMAEKESGRLGARAAPEGGAALIAFFEAAVQEIGEKASREKQVGPHGPRNESTDLPLLETETAGEAEREEGASEEGPAIAEVSDKAGSTIASPRDVSLADMLGRLTKAKTEEAGDHPTLKAAPEPARPGEKVVAGPTLPAPETEAAPAGENEARKPSLKLEILRTETHFEPTLGDAVLVEETDIKRPLEAKGGRSALLATLHEARGSKAEAPMVEPKPRFEIVVARIGVEPEGERALSPALRASAGSTVASAMSAASVVSPPPTSSPARAAPSLSARLDSRREAAVALPPVGNAVPSETAPGAIGGQVAGQVAARIIDVFAPETFREWSAERAPAEAHLRMQAGGAALKTLTLQLQPESLGTLHVSMRLVEGELTLELAASQNDTSRMLLEDRGSLKAILEKAGFSIDEASITVVTRDSALVGGSRQGEGGERGTDRGQGGASGGSSGEPRGGRDPERHAPARERSPAASPKRLDGSIYL